jgi:hypothetical protein
MVKGRVDRSREVSLGERMVVVKYLSDLGAYSLGESIVESCSLVR